MPNAFQIHNHTLRQLFEMKAFFRTQSVVRMGSEWVMCVYVYLYIIVK